MTAILASANGIAGDWAVEATLGRAHPEAEDYGAAAQGSIGLALRHGHWSYHLGYLNLLEMPLADAPPNTGIKLDGVTLEVSRIVDLQVLNISFGGGIFSSSAEASFSGNTLSDTRDMSPFLTAEGSLPLGERWEASVGYRWFFDVHGTDLRNPHIGISLSF